MRRGVRGRRQRRLPHRVAGRSKSGRRHRGGASRPVARREFRTIPPRHQGEPMIAHSATMLNLASVLEQQARLVPDRVALTCRDVNLTYGQLDARAAQIASGLVALGIEPGDHVALSCPNVPWFPMAYFGILKAGAVVVPLNVLLKPREIAYHLGDSDAKALLVFEGTPELPMAQMARAGCDDAGCPNLVVMTVDPAASSPVS